MVKGSYICTMMYVFLSLQSWLLSLIILWWVSRTRYFSESRQGHTPLHGRAYYQMMECLGVIFLNSKYSRYGFIFNHLFSTCTYFIIYLYCCFVKLIKIHSPMRADFHRVVKWVPSQSTLHAARMAAEKILRLKLIHQFFKHTLEELFWGWAFVARVWCLLLPCVIDLIVETLCRKPKKRLTYNNWFPSREWGALVQLRPPFGAKICGGLNLIHPLA